MQSVNIFVACIYREELSRKTYFTFKEKYEQFLELCDRSKRHEFILSSKYILFDKIFLNFLVTLVL
jgi:hypothetical protein